MDNEYAVMLTGTLVTGRAPTEVKQTLAGLFSISLEEIDSLLSKAPVRIKQNVDQDTARRYKVAVEKAGALCDVVEPLMDLEDTIPPGAAPGLQEALASTVASVRPGFAGHLGICSSLSSYPFTSSSSWGG